MVVWILGPVLIRQKSIKTSNPISRKNIIMSSSETSSSKTMLNLLPLPIVYASYQQKKKNKATSMLKVTKLSMASSSRLIPGGALDYQCKVQRLTSSAISETFEATKKMDALFSDDSEQQQHKQKQTQSSKDFSLFPEHLIDRNSLVIRVIYAGGFTDGSFFSNDGDETNNETESEIPVSKPNSTAAKDHSKLQHFSLSSAAGDVLESTSKRKSTTKTAAAAVTDDELFNHPQQNSSATEGNSLYNNNSFSSSSTTNFSTTPGLAFVGKVVAAGKNVYFFNEWVPDPSETSIIPRGFKEGDLVCGLQCDPSWLRGEPLRGSLGSYIVVPAGFVMRVSENDFDDSAKKLTTQNNTMHKPSSSPSLLSTIAGNLLPAVLWYSLFRWHIEPKDDESVLIMCVKTVGGNNSSLSSSITASSTSSLIPALGAIILSAKFRSSLSSWGKRKITIIANCEEDSKMLSKYKSQTKFFANTGNDDDEECNSELFDVVDISHKHDVDQLLKQKYNHIVVVGRSEKDDSKKTRHHNNSDDDDDNESDIEKEEDDSSTSMLIETILVKCLQQNGTIAHLSNSTVNCVNSASSLSMISSTLLLPIAMSKSGRLVFLSTRSLFDSTSQEKVRRSIAEVVSFFLNSANRIQLPQPPRIVKVDQGKVLDPLARQYKSFLLSQQQNNKNSNNNNSDENFYNLEKEYRQLADRTGSVVAEMISKSIGGLCSLLSSRRRQQREAEIFGGGDEHHRSVAKMNDVNFESGLNTLVVQFPQ